MKNNPLISIIIVNYNGKNLLENCFDSLSKLTYPNFEIILVDNNSKDDSVKYVKERYPNTTIIQLDKNYGFAKPNNIGAKKANGSYLLFLNNDTIVTENFIEELVEIMEKDPKIGISQSLLIRPNGEIDSSGDFVDNLGVSFSSKEKPAAIQNIFSARGASMMIRKTLFNKLEGFDEKFFISFEDVDLGWRSWIYGYKVVVVPNSIVYHLGGQSSKDMKNEFAFHGFKNQVAMKLTNFEWPLAIKIIFSFFLKYGQQTIKVFFDYKFKGKTTIQAIKYEEKIANKPNFRAIFKGIFWIFTNWRYLCKKHRFLEKNRKITTKDLIKKKVMIK